MCSGCSARGGDPLWDACFLTSTSRFVMNIDTLRVGML